MRNKSLLLKRSHSAPPSNGSSGQGGRGGSISHQDPPAAAPSVTWRSGEAACAAPASPPGAQRASPRPATRVHCGQARPPPQAPAPTAPTSCCFRRLLTAASFFARAIFTLWDAQWVLGSLLPRVQRGDWWGPPPQTAGEAAARPAPSQLLPVDTGLSAGVGNRSRNPHRTGLRANQSPEQGPQVPREGREACTPRHL